MIEKSGVFEKYINRSANILQNNQNYQNSTNIVLDTTQNEENTRNGTKLEVVNSSAYINADLHKSNQPRSKSPLPYSPSTQQKSTIPPSTPKSKIPSIENINEEKEERIEINNNSNSSSSGSGIVRNSPLRRQRYNPFRVGTRTPPSPTLSSPSGLVLSSMSPVDSPSMPPPPPQTLFSTARSPIDDFVAFTPSLHHISSPLSTNSTTNNITLTPTHPPTPPLTIDNSDPFAVFTSTSLPTTTITTMYDLNRDPSSLSGTTNDNNGGNNTLNQIQKSIWDVGDSDIL